MKPSSTNRSRRLITAIAALAVLVLAVGGASGDDRDLLRFNTAKPYLFIQLDTSGSMALAPDNTWLPGGGDDPQSRIYSAKQVLYEVFENVNDIHLGLATMDQDDFGIRSKHWNYTLKSAPSFPIPYPTAGATWTLGAHLGTNTAGSCANPINLATGQLKLDRFAKLGVDGLGPTYLWIRSGSSTYRMIVASSSDQIGKSNLQLSLTLQKFASDCTTVTAVEGPRNVNFDLAGQFLLAERDVGLNAAQAANEELYAGFWDWDDMNNSSVCPPDDNQRGLGWETNYDGMFSGAPSFTPSESNQDPYGLCIDRNDPLTCNNLKQATIEDSLGRPLDRGDVLPLDWRVDNLQEFLRRLAPNHGSGTPDFGAASYFQDKPGLDGYLRLKQPNQKPLVAHGVTPLGRMVGNFRCFYLGDDINKCSDTSLNPGWETLALANDTEWGCRRPYQIVVSDGFDTCKGPNPASDTANLNSKAGVRTWVIAYGADCTQPSNPLKPMADNGKGELVCPQTPQNLRDELNRILGIIREEATAFASAAAPSVQAIVDRSIYVSSFTPLNNQSRWDGHLDSFLKPLPLDIDGRPDKTQPQFQWDAGVELVAQAPDLAAALTGDFRLGLAETQRRVFYSNQRDASGAVQPGAWPGRRRGLLSIEDSTPAEVRYDLWRGLGIPFLRDDPAPPPGNSGVDQTAKDRSNTILAKTFAIRGYTLADGTPIQYVLGDIFHSDPLVVGTPANPRLFAENAGDDGRTCAAGNPSYRCFFRKHQFRRKQLLVGANDGQLHAFDAGVASVVTNAQGVDETRFNNGSGNEIFAYVPRAVLSSVRRIAEGSNHRFTVDSSPVASDVFIDPVFNGTPTASQREFRTVVITGLREGGSSYFALDITQPDTIGAGSLPAPRAGAEGFVPSCAATNNGLGPATPAGCGPVPYPAPLWEFDDTVYDTVNDRYVQLDEDVNGEPDLGDTWAPVAVGRIQFCDGPICDPTAVVNDVRDMWVAVFPGGMDPANKFYDPRTDSGAPGLRGSWLYMVDIETGRLIYKRELLVEEEDELRPAGAVAAGAAAVDTNQDGYLNRVYVATVGGYLLRVDLDRDPSGDAVSLADQTVASIERDPVTGNPVTYTVSRVPTLDSTSQPFWEPRVIFNANFDGNAATSEPRALYHEPSVIFVAQLGLYAVAFGTGDREDLWAGGGQAGRFYVFVDDTDSLNDSDLPLTEQKLVSVGLAGGNVGTNFLVTRGPGEKGWYLPLDPDERVVGEAFALAGVTFFSTFQPDVNVSPGKDPLCSKTGGSRIFIVNTTNANSFLQVNGAASRWMHAATFVTQPYTEQGSNPNASGGGGGGGGAPPPPGGTADDLSPQLQQVMDEIKKLYPSDCKFANYRIDIKTLASDTGVIFIAPVPVCLIEKNWKEF